MFEQLFKVTVRIPGRYAPLLLEFASPQAGTCHCFIKASSWGAADAIAQQLKEHLSELCHVSASIVGLEVAELALYTPLNVALSCSTLPNLPQGVSLNAPTADLIN